MNRLKSTIYLMILSAMIALYGCIDEDEQITPLSSEVLISIPSENSHLEMFEDSTNIPIPIILGGSVINTSTVSIDVSGQNSTYGVDYTTMPAAVDGVISYTLSTDEEVISVLLNPIFSPGFDESRQVSFTLSQGEGDFILFDNSGTYTVTILNRPELSIETNEISFGDVFEFTASDASSRAVVGAGLTSDLIAWTTEPFQVSLEEENDEYSDTLYIPSGGDTTSLDLFVRVNPAFDQLGSLSGSLNIHSDNASSRTIPLSAQSSMLPANLTANMESLDLGSANTNDSSDILSYRLTGFRLTQDVSIRSSNDDFKLSLDSLNFTTEATLGADQINHFDTVKVFVQFQPTQGTDGTKIAQLTHEFGGAEELLVSLVASENFRLLAYTSFEEPEPGSVNNYIGSDGIDQPNIPDQNPVDYESTGGELGFDMSYLPSEPAEQDSSIYFGVTNVISQSDGEGGFDYVIEAFPDGTQGYSTSDADGLAEIVFDQVELTTDYSELKVLMSVWFGNGDDTSFEESDEFDVFWRTEDGDEQLLMVRGVEPQDNIEDNDGNSIEDQWNSLELNVTNIKSGALIIQIGTNSGSELIFIDNIRILGAE